MTPDQIIERLASIKDDLWHARTCAAYQGVKDLIQDLHGQAVEDAGYALRLAALRVAAHERYFMPERVAGAPAPDGSPDASGVSA